MSSTGWQRVTLGAWLIAFASLGAADHIGVMGRQHNEWISGALIGDPPTRFRIAAEQVVSGSYTGLVIDMIEGDCVRRFAGLDVHLRNPVSQDLLTGDMEGALRVDRHPVHHVTYRVGALAGDEVIHIFLMEIEEEQAFWTEMAAGESVRFRFPTERKDYYLRFPLQGFTEAQQRATRLCNLPAEEDDRAYFKK